MVSYSRFSWVAAALAALPAAHARHFIMGGTRAIVNTRLDPIVSAGQLATHVHTVAGGSGFSNTYDYDTLSQSQCTTAVIKEDKSNYWTPSAYHFNKNNGSFSFMSSGFNIYYLVRQGHDGEQILAPPKGLRMLAGDTNSRSYNASSHADQAVSFVCLDYSGAHNGDPDWAERPNFFDHNCPNGMRAQVFFPSCWDGKNLDSADHKSHMAYPIENYNSGNCPSTHPVHLISIFYEMFIPVDQYSYDGAGTWVFANGDPTGRGFHGDFQNGWTDAGLQAVQQFIDTPECANTLGNIGDCPHLASIMDQTSADACRYPGEIVNEDIGDQHPIAALAGCNPVWDGTGTKPGCTATPTPGMKGTQEILATGWTEVGCIAEANNGRALTGAQLVDAVAMTKNKCAQFCQSKGFTLAGIEWSQECYCGNSFSNGASSNTVSADQCSNSCAGNQFETCGGPKRLTLLQFNPNGAPVSSVSAAPSSAPVVVPSLSVPISISSTVVSSAVSSVVQSATSVASAASSSAVISSSVSPVEPSSVSVSSSAPASQTSNILIPIPPVTKAPSAPASSIVTPSDITIIPTIVPSAPSNPVVPSTPANATVAPSAPAPAQPTPSGVPAGWTAAGCASDSSHRTLNARAMTSESLTVAQCLNFCTKEGFTMAGMEYGRECYCGNSFQNNEGKPLDNSKCSMPCTGQKDAQCGGDWALNVYTTTKRARGLKAKHFGRHHSHNTF